MNVSNKLKNKIINHENISEEESILFIEYMIYKTKIIVDNMYKKELYNYMYLFNEIAYSYNLLDNPYMENDYLYTIININNQKYLIDINYNKQKLEELNKNKYIKYTNEILEEYLIDKRD